MFGIFLLLWIIFNGRITIEVLAIGCVISLGVSFLFYKAMGYPLSSDSKFIRNLPLIIVYVLNLIVEIFKAAAQVAKLAWSKNKKPDPVLVEFRSGLKDPFSNVVLANSITLTPGTYTVVQEGDRFVVHCLSPEYAKGLDDSSFVRLLKKVKGVEA